MDNNGEETASTSSTRSSTHHPKKEDELYELKEYLTETDKEFFKIMNEMQEKKINRRSSFSRYGCGPELLVYTSD